MAEYFINFTADIDNDSLQVGDYAYSVTPFELGGFNQSINTTTGEEQTPLFLGVIVAIENNRILVDNTSVGSPLIPGPNDFIMFAKNTYTNLSGLVGYYAQATFANNSSEKAELYSIGSEITASSK
tara:strand:- start:260 stop:637 length:378 start_codon:yes stop_codon:yes gene_type:complete